MIHISSLNAEVAHGDEVFRTTSDPQHRHRVQILLMAHRGRREADIAADTGPSARSVQRWLNASLDRGHEKGRRPANSSC